MRLRCVRPGVAVLLVLLAGQAGPARAGQFGPTPAGGQAPGPAVAMPATPVNVDVEAESVTSVLKRLAVAARANLVFKGDIDRNVTITLHDAPFDQAVSLIARAAGLNVERLAGGYVIGAGTEAIYRAKYIRADRIVEALKSMFDPAQLKVISGPDEYHSPDLPPSGSGSSSSSYGSSSYGGSSYGGSSFGSGSSSSYGAGSSSNSSASQAPATLPPPPPGAIRAIVLSGDAEVVERALALCYELDRPRKQVRFSVKFTSFDFDWLRDFGFRWAWGNLSMTEQPKASASPSGQVPVFSIGKFTRDPLFFEAALTAAEDQGNHVLKSVPSITVLDGEHGHILIGERHLYPKLTGYTTAQTPIYDKEEVDIGISLDLGVRVSDTNDILLTLYPQVSEIIGYLETNDASYPQISTLEQKTTIHVRDGETIVIGGLLSDESVDRTHGIPGLMKIPLLKHFFTYRSRETRKQDVVILIAAEVVKEENR